MDLLDFGLEFGNLDFVCYVESYGVKGYVVDSVSLLEWLLVEVLNSGGVYFIDCLIDYSDSKCFIFDELL